MRLVAFASLALMLVSVQAHGTPGPASGIRQFFNTGCKVTRSVAQGCAIASVKGPIRPGPLERGSKTGEACGWNLLALISVGDVRVETAMRNGGISQISSVDYRTFELVPGFYGYSRYCTVVTGE